MNVLGLDIGGANLKAATHDGETRSQAFPLWQRPNELAQALQDLGKQLCKTPDLVAVTMTGELADCFSTKSDGVLFIIDQVEAAFPNQLVRLWLTSGEFADPEDARDLPALAAAANWHALATWVARIAPQGLAILMDVGSTTTDLIPLQDGLPASRGTSDFERLAYQELLYTGASRTPVCAVAQTITMRGQQIPLAAELFATMQDVHIVVGSIPEDADNNDTADGRPATRAHSLNRLAHMLCCDVTELTESELTAVARQLAAAQRQTIGSAVTNLLDAVSEQAAPPVLVVSGSGSFIANKVIAEIDPARIGPVFELSAMYRNDVSTAACAFAVARLAAERCLDDLLPLTSL
jgi:probable H4MPT-linked C1 transfer pathway protein